MNSTIPKVIHYCWFGGKPLPKLALKCIESWKYFCPDFEIREWNESNFDIHCCRYVSQAYERKRWAFVSDYARFKILYDYGGIYFDTDVELIKPIDDLIDKGSFMGAEPGVSAIPGLGLAAAPGLGLYREIIDYYEDVSFVDELGEDIVLDTVVTRTTRILKEHGYKGNGTVEKICDIYIYPPEYFCPKNFRTGELQITDNTRSIHHYTASWLTEREKKLSDIELWVGKRFGEITRTRLKKNSFWIFVSSLYKVGARRTMIKTLNRICTKFKTGGVNSRQYISVYSLGGVA